LERIHLVQNRSQLVIVGPLHDVFTPAVVGSGILIIATYVAFSFWPEQVVTAMSLQKHTISEGKIWQLVTYPLLNTCGWPLVINLAGILFIGSRLERSWNSGSWIMLWLIVSVMVGIFFWIASLFIRNLIVLGSAVPVYGLLGAYALVFRNNPSLLFFGAMKSHHAAILLIIAGALLSLSQPVMLIGVSGAGVAYVYTRIRWHIANRAGGKRFTSQARRPGAFVDVD
jgi:membrane associated rhomboid family serine protease